jgi:hypothetical protein
MPAEVPVRGDQDPLKAAQRWWSGSAVLRVPIDSGSATDRPPVATPGQSKGLLLQSVSVGFRMFKPGLRSGRWRVGALDLFATCSSLPWPKIYG